MPQGAGLGNRKFRLGFERYQPIYGSFQTVPATTPLVVSHVVGRSRPRSRLLAPAQPAGVNVPATLALGVAQKPPVRAKRPRSVVASIPTFLATASTIARQKPRVKPGQPRFFVGPETRPVLPKRSLQKARTRPVAPGRVSPALAPPPTPVPTIKRATQKPRTSPVLPRRLSPAPVSTATLPSTIPMEKPNRAVARQRSRSRLVVAMPGVDAGTLSTAPSIVRQKPRPFQIAPRSRVAGLPSVPGTPATTARAKQKLSAEQVTPRSNVASPPGTPPATVPATTTRPPRRVRPSSRPRPRAVVPVVKIVTPGVPTTQARTQVRRPRPTRVAPALYSAASGTPSPTLAQAIQAAKQPRRSPGQILRPATAPASGVKPTTVSVRQKARTQPTKPRTIVTLASGFHPVATVVQTRQKPRPTRAKQRSVVASVTFVAPIVSIAIATRRAPVKPTRVEPQIALVPLAAAGESATLLYFQRREGERRVRPGTKIAPVKQVPATTSRVRQKLSAEPLTPRSIVASTPPPPNASATTVTVRQKSRVKPVGVRLVKPASAPIPFAVTNRARQKPATRRPSDRTRSPIAPAGIPTIKFFAAKATQKSRIKPVAPRKFSPAIVSVNAPASTQGRAIQKPRVKPGVPRRVAPAIVSITNPSATSLQSIQKARVKPLVPRRTLPALAPPSGAPSTLGLRARQKQPLPTRSFSHQAVQVVIIIPKLPGSVAAVDRLAYSVMAFDRLAQAMVGIYNRLAGSVLARDFQ